MRRSISWMRSMGFLPPWVAGTLAMFGPACREPGKADPRAGQSARRDRGHPRIVPGDTAGRMGALYCPARDDRGTDADRTMPAGTAELARGGPLSSHRGAHGRDATPPQRPWEARDPHRAGVAPFLQADPLAAR